MAFDRSSIRPGITHLRVTQNGKVVSLAISKMDDNLLRAALTRPDNASAIADGWYADGGNIYKRPAAAAPAPAQPAPAPPASSGVGTVPAGTPAPVNVDKGKFDRTAIRPGVTHLKVIQNGKVVTYAIDRMDDVLLKKALMRPDNASALAPGWVISGDKIVKQPGAGGGSSTGTPRPDTHADPGGGGAGPGSPAAGGGGGAAPTTTTPAPTTTGPKPPSWIPPMVGLGGLNADPLTGKIDWSKLIQAAHEISAVDPQYAQDISGNIFQTMQALAPMQSEIQSLTAIDPTSGKTMYQSLFENAMKKFKADTSKSFGTAAARGIGSSGMLNKTIADQSAGNAQTISGYGKTHGNARISDLLKSMTEQLGAQDTNFSGSYYSALSRAYGGIPQIPGVTG